MRDEELYSEPLTDATEAIKDIPDGKSEDPEVHGVARFVEERYNRASTAKQMEEERARRAYRNFRGLYDPSMMFTDTEKSRVFVKVTKTKVLAAYGQLSEVLFGNNKFPLSIEPSQLPEGVAEAVHLDTDEQVSSNSDAKQVTASPFGTREDGPLPPGTTFFDLARAGPLKDKLSPFKDKLVEGQGSTPTSITFHPAMVAAKKMEKKIHDQLEESHANKHLRSVAFEMALYGTGVMKGPFAIEKEYPNWNEDGEYEPTFRLIPEISSVSFWNFYPDPDANNMQEAQWAIERHKMSRNQLKALKRREFFRENAIDLAVEYGENYQKKDWETDIEDSNADGLSSDRFEVLEFWGFCDTELLEENYDFNIPKSLKDYETLNVNIWICNGQVIRCVLNPFKPAHIPYHVVPYEVTPYSMWGVGIAENMDDSQTLMNGFMRMAVDNAVLSGNLIFEVDESMLTPGQDLKMYPGKVFRRDGGAPGQSIFSTQYPNVSQQNIMMYEKARELADESTGLPSYSHGQTGVQGVGRTASGISMLMNAANGGIRTVVKNVDDYLLAPLGKALFAFNMQFDFDPSIKGDLEVVARGTESLMANEVRSQRLMQFLGVVSNPVLAPFARMDVIVREIAKSLDLDPDKVVNNLADAALQAEVFKRFQQDQMGPSPTGQAPPAGANPMDPTGAGGGTIGTGIAPGPQEPGFAGNTNSGVM